jgi:hypothetical protein
VPERMPRHSARVTRARLEVRNSRISLLASTERSVAAPPAG